MCDYDLKILSVNARYAGATHDAFIFDASQVNNVLEERYAGRQGNQAWLLVSICTYIKTELIQQIVFIRVILDIHYVPGLLLHLKAPQMNESTILIINTLKGETASSV